LGLRDAITNEEIYSKKDAISFSNESKDSYLKRITHFQIQLGKELKSSEFLNYKIDDLSLDDPSTIFGINFRLSKRAEAGYKSLKINPNHTELFKNGIFYGGNYYPSNPENQEPITFDELANSSGEGINRLGILRMDVDNLGKLFIKGFRKETHIAAYHELSFRLDGFFKGYLNQLVKENYGDKVIILYSGGDDLFIAGAYQPILQLAGEIRNQFKKWTGGSMHPGISGGIAIVGGKFPVIKAAEIAGELEKKAKGFSREGQTLKNSLCLFDIPFSWEGEFEEVMNWKEKWKGWLESGKISKSILFKMYQYFQAKERQELSWQWQSLYTLKRQEKKADQEVIDFLKSNVILRGANNYRALDLCIIGGRLAELNLRNK
jgi:CRISPR-associated protein Csm1